MARLRYYPAFGRVTCNGVTLTLENMAWAIPRRNEGYMSWNCTVNTHVV
jgi:hypothetical protein